MDDISLLIFIDKFTSGLQNRMRSSLYQSFPEFEMVFPKNTLSSNTSRHLLMQGLSNAQRLNEISIDDLSTALKKGSRGRIGYDRAVQLKQFADESFGIPRGAKGRSLALRFGAQLLEFLLETAIPLQHLVQLFLHIAAPGL